MLSRLLILEGSWGEKPNDYISDSLSTTRVYSALEALLWIHGTPIRIIQRPLLNGRFISDLHQFTSLRSNKTGINIVVLTAHGKKRSKQKLHSRRKTHKRTLRAIDGTLNLSAKIQKLSQKLSRTILIIDSCQVGADLGSLLQASGALGIIGFAADVDWIDSSTFVLAILLKFHEEGVFTSTKSRALTAARRVMSQMESGAFSSLWEELEAEYLFR